MSRHPELDACYHAGGVQCPVCTAEVVLAMMSSCAPTPPIPSSFFSGEKSRWNSRIHYFLVQSGSFNGQFTRARMSETLFKNQAGWRVANLCHHHLNSVLLGPVALFLNQLFAPLRHSAVWRKADRPCSPGAGLRAYSWDGKCVCWRTF